MAQEKLGMRVMAAWAAVLAVFVLLAAYVTGGAGAYVQMVLAVPLIAMVLFVRNWRSESAGNLNALAFAILTALFVINNPPGGNDYVSALNFVFLLLLGPLVVAMSSDARTTNSVLVARLASVATLVALAWSALQVYVYHVNPDTVGGFFANRIQSAGAATIFAFIATIGLVADRSRWRWLYLLVPVLGFGVVWLGASRGPLIIFVILATVSAIYFSRRKVLTVAALAGVFVAGGAVLTLFPKAFGRLGRLPEIIMNALAGAHSDDNSGNIRLDLYQDGIRAFLRSPWIGYGWRGKAAATYPGDLQIVRIREHWHLHSDVLDFAVSGGIVGLVVYCLLIAAPIVGAVRSEHDSQRQARILGATMLAIGLLSYGLFNAAFGFEYFTMIYVVMTAVLLGFCRDRPLFGRRA